MCECKVCGKECRRKQTLCSEECREAYFREDVQCCVCGKVTRKPKKRKTNSIGEVCSPECLKMRSKTTRTCKHCGEQFAIENGRAKLKPYEFCSRQCVNESRKRKCTNCGKPTEGSRNTCSDECSKARVLQSHEVSLGFALDDPWRAATARAMKIGQRRGHYSRSRQDEWKVKCETVARGLRSRYRTRTKNRATKRREHWEEAISDALKAFASKARRLRMDAWDRKCESVASNGRKRMYAKQRSKSELPAVSD